MKTTPWACAAVVAALVAAVNGQEAAPAPRSVAVEAVEEPATAETEGALEGLSALPVRLRPEAYGGPWYVEGLPLADGTTVEAGARLAALSAPRLDDAVREATEALEGARVRLENQRRSTERAQAQHDTAVERSELERDLAERGYRFFVENEGPRMLRGAELGVQSREHRLADEQEELSQLEGMYERSELAGETQEIVVARARRELAMSEAWLGLERAREEQVRLHEHPSQLARLELELRSRALSAELQAVEREVALSRRDLELREAEARVRDATERLARLERDRAALEVRSPAAGLWTTGSWEPADEVRSGQVLGRVADTSGWAVSARLPLGPGGAPEAGGAVTVRLAAPLEMDLEGRLVWVSGRAAKDKESAGGTRLEARIEMPAADPRLRAGLPCKVLTPGLPRRLLVVAAEALRNDAEGRHVLVEDGGAGRRVKVEATERADGRFEVKGTLSAGDRVLVPEPPAEGGAPR